MYWPFSTRTTVALVAALVIWFVVAQPMKAGADFSHFLHWLAWAASRIARFVRSI